MKEDSFLNLLVGGLGLIGLGFLLGLGCGGATSGEGQRRGYVEGVTSACAPAKALMTVEGKFSRCAP